MIDDYRHSKPNLFDLSVESINKKPKKKIKKTERKPVRKLSIAENYVY